MTRQLATAIIVLCLTPSLVLAQGTPNPQPVHFTVDTLSATVHKSPSVGSPIVGKLTRGRSLEVSRELGDWVKVTWPETEEGFGYMHVSTGRLTRGGMPRQTTDAVSTGSRPAPRSTWSTAPSSTAPQPPSVEDVVRTNTTRTVYVPPPTHFVGVGGRMSGSTLGFGVTGRAWSRGSLGGQVDVSRMAQTTAGLPGRVTTIQFAPSVLYGFADFVSDYVWLRPYVGAGGSLHRHTMSGITPEASDSQTKFSFQSFGGAEFTLASVPRFAISVDAGYDWAKTPFDGYDAGGMGFSISGRWYFK